MIAPTSSACLVIASHHQTFASAALRQTYDNIVRRRNGIVLKYSKFQGKTSLGTEGWIPVMIS